MTATNSDGSTNPNVDSNHIANRNRYSHSNTDVHVGELPSCDEYKQILCWAHTHIYLLALRAAVPLVILNNRRIESKFAIPLF